MVRWLERNGYDVSYTSGIDSDRLPRRAARAQDLPVRRPRRVLVRGAARQRRGGPRGRREPRVLQRQRGVLEDALGDSIDGARRTARSSPTRRRTRTARSTRSRTTWTGTWRDPRFSPPGDGGRPENALTGQLFTVNAGATTAIKVPAADGKMRFWRNTTIATQAAGATATLPDGTLGYEWDEDADNGFRPAGLVPPLRDHGRRAPPRCSTTARTSARGTAGPQPDALPAPRAARSCSAPAPCSGRGGSTRTTTAAASRPTSACSRRREPVRRHGRPARDAADRPGGGDGLHRHDARRRRRSPRPRPAAACRRAATITISGTATDTGGGVVGGVEVSIERRRDLARARTGAARGPSAGRPARRRATRSAAGPSTTAATSRRPDRASR